MPHPKVLLPIPYISCCIELLPVEGATFLMGENDSDYADEKPEHEVRVNTFYISRFPVTQELWKAVMNGQNPSFFAGDHRPVDSVSWNEVQTFLEKLRQITQKDFRLPTEAEWEYAARGGALSEGYMFCGGDSLAKVGWFYGNSGGETRDVGLLHANELGLHDMSGNVWEWCADRYSETWYQECFENGTVENPGGPATGEYRILRGGSIIGDASGCLPSARFRLPPDERRNDCGFRPAMNYSLPG